MGFDYEIQYKQGKDNLVVDALSRGQFDPAVSEVDVLDSKECLAISYPYSQWMDELRRHLEKDASILQKIQQVLSNFSDKDLVGNLRYQMDNGFLKFKHRIVLSPHSSWRTKLFEEHHSSPTAGHEGFLKTYKRISRSFFWEGMKKNVKELVANCPICQQNKYETLSPLGLLQPLPIPTKI